MRSDSLTSNITLSIVGRNIPGSSISGDVTPVSIASELEFNSNEATAGSITDHDLLVCTYTSNLSRGISYIKTAVITVTDKSIGPCNLVTP